MDKKKTIVYKGTKKKRKMILTLTISGRNGNKNVRVKALENCKVKRKRINKRNIKVGLK